MIRRDEKCEKLVFHIAKFPIQHEMFICPTRKSLNFTNIVQESEKVRQAATLKLIDTKGVIGATTVKVGLERWQ